MYVREGLFFLGGEGGGVGKEGLPYLFGHKLIPAISWEPKLLTDKLSFNHRES